MSNCQQLEEHYGAYALGALEGEDLAALAEHLDRGCPLCTQGVEQARWVVSQLAYLAPESEPPASLREGVLDYARNEEPRERSVWIPRWAWLGAVALVLFSIYNGYQANQVQRRIAELEQWLAQQKQEKLQLEQELTQRSKVMAILSAQGTRELNLKAAEASLPAVRAFWNQQHGLVLSAQQMPLPAAERTFQLWVVPRQGNPISAGIFRPNGGGRLLHLVIPQAKLADARALAITEEPAGGSPAPTTKPIWVAPIT